MEFENAFSRPEKGMDFRKNDKVMEFHFLVQLFYAVWKLETFLSLKKKYAPKGLKSLDFIVQFCLNPAIVCFVFIAGNSSGFFYHSVVK